MKIYGINGSPRKNKNTHILLNKALDGAASCGAETELIHLYDLNFKGCVSCFACKVKNGKSFGKCARQDDLTGVLQKLERADGIILGSPIYYASVTGEMRCFLERFLFPYMQYSKEDSILFNRQIPAGFIYSMNAVNDDQLKHFGVDVHLGLNSMYLKLLTNHSEHLYSFNNVQFDDYDRYVTDDVDRESKLQFRKDVFPVDCEKAFDMGKRFASGDVSYEKINFGEQFNEDPA